MTSIARCVGLLRRTKIRYTERIKVKHYSDALSSATKFESTQDKLQCYTTDLEKDQKEIAQKDTLQDISSKRQALLSLEFEAAMYCYVKLQHSTTALNLSHLSAIISTAQNLSASRKTYALFADIVLSSAYTQSKDELGANSNGSSSRTVVSIPIAATLLTQIITSTRTLPDYNTSRAARWIRCLVQLCLDQHQTQQFHQNASSPNHSESQHHAYTPVDSQSRPPLTIAEDLTTQAISLARQSLEDRNESNNSRHDSGAAGSEPLLPLSLYPAEELEWLSTTLFNLGVDFHVGKYSHLIHTHDHQSNLNHHDPVMAAPHTTSTHVEAQSQIQARRWTSLAVEIADVIADYDGEDGGDHGLLGRVLRGKIRNGGVGLG